MSEKYIPCAFPILERGSHGLELTDPGMTLRDYFAAKAMQVLLQEAVKIGATLDATPHAVVASYEIADAMLEARKTHMKK